MGKNTNNQTKKPKVPRGTLKEIAIELEKPYGTIQTRWQRGEPIVVNRVLKVLKEINTARKENHALKQAMDLDF